MNKVIAFVVLSSFIFGSYAYNGSVTSAVVLAGSIIKSHQIENVKKYKRKDCPVCKGKGWYISGDDITKVPCGYCESDSSETQLEITHPPVILKQTGCKNPDCKCTNCKCKRCGCVPSVPD